MARLGKMGNVGWGKKMILAIPGPRLDAAAWPWLIHPPHFGPAIRNLKRLAFVDEPRRRPAMRRQKIGGKSVAVIDVNGVLAKFDPG